MQTVVTTLPAPPVMTSPFRATAKSPCSATTLVVFSAVDEVLQDTPVDSTSDARAALRMLAQRQIPIVLTSLRPAAELLALQRQLGIRYPFVAAGGESLHIPAGYFPQLTRIGAQVDGWNIVEFKVPEAGHAVRLLLSLYRLCSEDVVIVALGNSTQHRALLHGADVPVIVRSPDGGQEVLLRELPAAYLTVAAGAAGWSEAILGSVEE